MDKEASTTVIYSQKDSWIFICSVTILQKPWKVSDRYLTAQDREWRITAVEFVTAVTTIIASITSLSGVDTTAVLTGELWRRTAKPCTTHTYTRLQTTLRTGTPSLEVAPTTLATLSSSCDREPNLWPWPWNVTSIVPIWTSRPNIWIKGYLVQTPTTHVVPTAIPRPLKS